MFPHQPPLQHYPYAYSSQAYPQANMQPMQPGMMPVNMMGGMPIGQQGMMPINGVGVGMPMQGMTMQQHLPTYQTLRYGYTLPDLGYAPQSGWGVWELARQHYQGIERTLVDSIVASLGSIFTSRKMKEEKAMEAHERIYHRNNGCDAGNRSMGGAAAYQSFLLWERDFAPVYHSYPADENRKRIVGIAVGELHRLWETVQPRSTRANIRIASEWAAATAQHLYDRHYVQGAHYGMSHGHPHSGNLHRRLSSASSSSDSDRSYKSRRSRRRSRRYSNRDYDAGLGFQPSIQPGTAPGVPVQGAVPVAGQQQYGYGYPQQPYAGPYAYPGYAASYAQQPQVQPYAQPGYVAAGYPVGFAAQPGYYPPQQGYYPGTQDPTIQVSTILARIASHSPPEPQSQSQAQTQAAHLAQAHPGAMIPFLSAAFHLLASLYTLPANLLLRSVELAKQAPNKVQVHTRSLCNAGRNVGHSLAEHLTLDALARRHRAQLDQAERDARKGLHALLLHCLTDQYRDPTAAQFAQQGFYAQPQGYGYPQQGYGYPRYF